MAWSRQSINHAELSIQKEVIKSPKRQRDGLEVQSIKVPVSSLEGTREKPRANINPEAEKQIIVEEQLIDLLRNLAITKQYQGSSEFILSTDFPQSAPLPDLERLRNSAEHVSFNESIHKATQETQPKAETQPTLIKPDSTALPTVPPEKIDRRGGTKSDNDSIVSGHIEKPTTVQLPKPPRKRKYMYLNSKLNVIVSEEYPRKLKKALGGSTLSDHGSANSGNTASSSKNHITSTTENQSKQIRSKEKAVNDQAKGRKMFSKLVKKTQDLPARTTKQTTQDNHPFISTIPNCPTDKKTDVRDRSIEERKRLVGSSKRKNREYDESHSVPDIGEPLKLRRIPNNEKEPAEITTPSHLGVQERSVKLKMQKLKPSDSKASKTRAKKSVQTKVKIGSPIDKKVSDRRKKVVKIDINHPGNLNKMENWRRTKKNYRALDRRWSTYAAIEEAGNGILQQIEFQIDFKIFDQSKNTGILTEQFSLLIDHSVKALAGYIEQLNDMLIPPFYSDLSDVRKAQKAACAILIDYWKELVNPQGFHQLEDSSRNTPKVFITLERDKEIKTSIQSSTRGPDLTTRKRITNLIFESWLETHFKVFFRQACDKSNNLKKWIIALMNDTILDRQPTISSFQGYTAGKGRATQSKGLAYVQFLSLPEFKIIWNPAGSNVFQK